MSATQQQIAEVLGVSRQAVSFALNGGGTLSQETRAQIIKAATEMGYRPNHSARAMRSGRFDCIALLLSTQTNRTYLPGELFRGILDELALHDMHLSVTRLPDEKLSDPDFVPKIMRELMVDGLLIDYIFNVPKHLIKMIEQHQIPSIWVNSQRENDCVYPDDYEGAYGATRHLLELGHRCIAYVEQPHNMHYSAHERRRGYEQAMGEARLKPEIFCGADCHTEEVLLTTQLESWLQSEKRPTAVFAYEAYSAIPVLAAATRVGLRIPDQLSLIGVHDDLISKPGFGVSTMILPVYEMGRTAVRMLLQKIAQPQKLLEPCMLPLQLEAGRTCAPPQNA
jgi:LacI family transcriptional regulator